MGTVLTSAYASAFGFELKNVFRDWLEVGCCWSLWEACLWSGKSGQNSRVFEFFLRPYVLKRFQLNFFVFQKNFFNFGSCSAGCDVQSKQLIISHFFVATYRDWWTFSWARRSGLGKWCKRWLLLMLRRLHNDVTGERMRFEHWLELLAWNRRSCWNWLFFLNNRGCWQNGVVTRDVLDLFSFWIAFKSGRVDDLRAAQHSEATMPTPACASDFYGTWVLS